MKRADRSRMGLQPLLATRYRELQIPGTLDAPLQSGSACLMVMVSPFAAGLAHLRQGRSRFPSHIVEETGAAHARGPKNDQASVRLLFVLYGRVSSLIRERTGSFAAAP